MMIKEKFLKLIELYDAAAEGKGITSQQVFQKSLEFIELLKRQVLLGDEEDRQAAIGMMNELFQKIQVNFKAMSERLGVSEEQLFSENPSSHSPEQWRQLQESKEKLAKAGKDLMRVLEIPKGAHRIPVESKSSVKKGGLRKRKGKKSQWMRS